MKGIKFRERGGLDQESLEMPSRLLVSTCCYSFMDSLSAFLVIGVCTKMLVQY